MTEKNALIFIKINGTLSARFRIFERNEENFNMD